MRIEVRQAVHPEAVRHADTYELRRHFLVESLFTPGEVLLTYTHVDRVVIGGAMPTDAPLDLPAAKALGTSSFLERRELGIVNIGGPARILVGETAYTLHRLHALYVGMGAGEVRFESTVAGDPAKLYLVSAPAHRQHPSRLIATADGRTLERGSPAQSNERTIHQMIHPAICASCQLVLGMTLLKPNSMWNTMPTHTHDRQADPDRSAAILSRIPAGRWGEPVDIGGAVVFLLSRAADYVHGVVLPVDGGWLAR